MNDNWANEVVGGNVNKGSSLNGSTELWLIAPLPSPLPAHRCQANVSMGTQKDSDGKVNLQCGMNLGTITRLGKG